MNFKEKIRIFGILLLVSVFISISCSTKKNTFTRRVYHNLTSHYNAYWNGDESFKQGVMELESKLTDDFNKILPVYSYGTKDEAQSINPAMDKAIEKASMVIQQHSMKFGGKEYVRWIDDSYMLIGKAYFYKHEYISARRTFNYVINEYPENEARYFGMLWLAKTYNQMEEFEKSKPLLMSMYEIEDKTQLPFKVVKELPLVIANSFILQENYADAIPYLYRGIELNSDRDTKTRLMFILAQIQQSLDNLAEATKFYLKVIKRNPPYDMAFQAKINLAQSYEAESGNKEQIVKTLEKMLKDIKNKEYQDQIYFALADVALKDGNDTLGIHYLRLSVATSQTNNYQKATSSLKLADIYFEIPEYELAEAYYDTAVKSLPLDCPKYKDIKAKSLVLSDLVDNLTTIQLQDSLQKLGRMPEEERLAIVDRLIEDYIEAEKRKMEEELFRQQNALAQGNEFSQAGGSGSWYFYNNALKSQGFNEFKQRWGDRKLEDLWRLSNKQMLSFGEEEFASSDTLQPDSAKIISSNPREPDYYLKDIPISDEEFLASDQKMMEAYFNLGRAYKEGLDNYPKAIEAYETLISRFPENEYLPKAYYDLYKIYQEQGDTAKMENYKNLILEEFPDSDFARVIINPNYFKELSEKENEAENLYLKTYNAHLKDQHFLVINYSNRAIEEYSESELMPKFHYLRALSIGRIEVQDSLVSELRYLVSTYPKSEVTPMAESMLQKLTTVEAAGESAKAEEEKSPYNYAPNESQFVAFVVNMDSVNVPALKIRLSDFNNKYFRLRKLKVNSIILNSKQQIITVGNFNNKGDAMNYYNLIKKDEYVISNLNQENYDLFVISAGNYPVFYKDKEVVPYMKFFEKNYINK